MSLVSPLCQIPANPDISGIGVRIAIYAQKLLSFVPALWALWDGEVSTTNSTVSRLSPRPSS
ncbi:hypothetical protein B0H13DRAFT_2120053 [Mycena leptocephala]|nr:hypothetical protein B0H13DRAFT_2120053 [Mycena leptocephala]